MKIESATILCKYCGLVLPTMPVVEKRFKTKWEFDALVMCDIRVIQGFFFHKHCTEKPEFPGWVSRFIQKIKYRR